MVGLWKVPDSVKMTADAYIAFLRESLELWLKKQRITLKATIIFTKDTALSHTVKKTRGSVMIKLL